MKKNVGKHRKVYGYFIYRERCKNSIKNNKSINHFIKYFMKYFIKFLTFTISRFIIICMKVGQLVNRINIRLKENFTDISPQDNLKTSNVNGYKAQGFIKPPPAKANGKSYFEYTDIHEELIYKAFTKILLGIRTNVAFEKASEELHSLF